MRIKRALLLSSHEMYTQVTEDKFVLKGSINLALTDCDHNYEYITSERRRKITNRLKK